MVDIKPIYLSKGYLFQNNIYYLDKIYLHEIHLCFAKIKFSKHALHRSSRPEVFHKKVVVRNFAKFTGKNTCTNIFLINWRPETCNFVKRETLAQVFSCEFCEISKNTSFYKTPPVAASVCIN